MPLEREERCPRCGRSVPVGGDGRFVTHGPGRTTFTCPGGGMVAPCLPHVWREDDSDRSRLTVRECVRCGKTEVVPYEEEG